MGGILLFLLFLGVIAMFGFLKAKRESQQGGTSSLGRLVKLASVFWDAADIEVRSLLLRNLKNFEDDKLFLAYVNAPFSRLPYKVQLAMGPLVNIYQQTPSLLDR
jgi:hypothetical protein